MQEDGSEKIQDAVGKSQQNAAATETENVGDSKAEDVKVDTPQKDEFGLPVRPPRRKEYDDEEEDEAFQDARTDQGELVDVKEIETSPTNLEAGELSLQGTEANEEQNQDQGEAVSEKDNEASPRTSGTERLPPLQTEAIEEVIPEPATPKSRKVGNPETPASARSRDLVEQLAQSPTNAQDPKDAVAGGFSEWSHQQLAPRESEKASGDDEDGWQEMPALATHRVYDDWGKVIAKGYDEVDDETVEYGALGGAGKGYTRVQVDDDATSQNSFDDNTAYLFKDGYAHNALDDDDETRDVISQMQTTKEILTEGQRMAYVGVVRLSMIRMLERLEGIERTRGSKRSIDLAAEAMRMWSQKMMVRLYSHMEIDSQEQVMVEQLADHGVLPEDLTPTLMQNARVKNPKVKEEAPSDQSSARPSVSSPGPSSEAELQVPEPPSPSPGTPTSEAPPPAYEQQTADGLHVERPEDLPDTKNIDLDIRWTVLCDLFLVLIADGIYDARSRTLLERVGAALAIEWQEICRFEKRITDSLEMQEQAGKETWNETEHLESRKKANRKRRLVVMGLCTVGGGLVIGLSAGVLAPVIGAGLAAGFTTIGVAGTSSFFAGTGAAALIGTTGALTGARIGINASSRRTGAVQTFEYRPLHNNKRVNLIVSVSGWMTGNVDDVRLPFSTVDPVMGDIYSVHWEPEMLKSTGQTIQILATEALTQTIQQILGATFLTTLMAGLATPIVLTKLAYLIDNPWTVSLARADAAGLIMADSLIDRNLGSRPITLVGFSLGARVIFACLKEMARRGAIGLIQNAYLFGSPIVTKKDDWRRARSVVSGRLVNGYASHDWILGYLFRATSGGIMAISGLSEVQVPGVENVNFSEIVPGHMAYRGMMPILLSEVGWEVESDEFSEIEDPDPDNHEKRQRELISEIEEARRQLDERPEKRGFLARFSRKKAAQKKDWETYDEKTLAAAGKDEDPERLAQDNADVMFDVDAIRREALELAKRGEPTEDILGHISIREIESTLPPMRISSASLTPPPPTPPPPQPQPSRQSALGAADASPGVRQTRSHDGPPRTHSFGGTAAGATSSLSTRPSIEAPLHPSSPSPSPSPSPTPARLSNGDGAHGRLSSHPGRPALQTSTSSPAPSTGPSGSSPSPSVPAKPKPWADEDEEEFGREREVEMSFE